MAPAGVRVDRLLDMPAAAAVIGVTAPQTLRSAADVPDLHRAWLLALAAGLVTVTGGKAGPRSIALPDQDAEVLSAWLDALRASAAAEYGQRSVPDDILLSFLEVVAEDPAGPRVQGWVQRRSACWTLLDAFGAVAEGPEVTPLGRWAMQRLADSQPVMPENLTAAEMLACLAKFDQAQRRDLAWEWMAERDPEEAVREILRAAASMSPRMRWSCGWQHRGLVSSRMPYPMFVRMARMTCGTRRRAVYSPRSEPSLARRSSSSASSVRRRLISRLTRLSSALACCSLT
jgi:hypothetical protein